MGFNSVFKGLTTNAGKSFPLLSFLSHSYNMNFSSYSSSLEVNIYEFFRFGIKNRILDAIWDVLSHISAYSVTEISV